VCERFADGDEGARQIEADHLLPRLTARLRDTTAHPSTRHVQQPVWRSEAFGGGRDRGADAGLVREIRVHDVRLAAGVTREEDAAIVARQPRDDRSAEAARSAGDDQIFHVRPSQLV
jgi:hypothetical protein